MYSVVYAGKWVLVAAACALCHFFSSLSSSTSFQQTDEVYRRNICSAGRMDTTDFVGSQIDHPNLQVISDIPIVGQREPGVVQQATALHTENNSPPPPRAVVVDTLPSDP